MGAFLAFLDHVHGLLTTTYHNTPIMLMASPQWTRPDCETIAQFIFEKTRTPALCLIHSAIATQYGLRFPNMTVVDIGYEKVDVTAIHDGRVVNHMDLGTPKPDRHISGGEVFSQKLLRLLEGKGFNRDMVEQLKKSNICEVLPYAAGGKNLVELPVETAASTAAAAAAAAPASTAPVPTAAPPSSAPDAASADAPDTAAEPPKPSEAVVTENGENGEANGDEDGVLDVASIVTSGQTKEFLAKKEKEKEKGKGGRKPKDKEADTAPNKPLRLPNSKRTHNTFGFEEIVQELVPPEPKEIPAVAAAAAPTNGVGQSASVPLSEIQTNGTSAPDATPGASALADAPAAAVPGTAASSEEVKTEGASDAVVDAEATKPADLVVPSTETVAPAPASETKPDAANANDTPEYRAKRVRRDIEVGLERFTFADRDEIDRIVTTIYQTVQGIDDMYMRPACWDNLVFVGNGSRLRGLKDNILQTLNARHLISPSTATIFTSELPSNMATPTGTGAQTPTGSFTGAPHQLSSSGVNPLLQAATTASSLGVGAVTTPQAGSEAAGPTTTHHFHSQTPTSIKTVSLPTYLQEWSKNGFEEAMFLGAQVAARITFCLHSNMDAQSIEAQRLASLSRVDYK
jgi:actin-related protein 9